MEADHIDQLLERYLVLLDEYTVLRELLSKTQAGIYHNIARANFSAERGVRYGPDYYDDRMQASRILSIASDSKGVPRFDLVEPMEAATELEAHGAPDFGEKKHDKVEEASAAKTKPDDKTTTTKKASKDPLRWFGILAPQSLRQAQTLSVQALHVIPRLVSVNAEMMDLEIEVRRARKKRAKAETAQKKVDAEDGQGTERHESHARLAVDEST